METLPKQIGLPIPHLQKSSTNKSERETTTCLLSMHVVLPHLTSLQMQSLCSDVVTMRGWDMHLFHSMPRALSIRGRFAFVFGFGFFFKGSSKLLLVCWMLSVLPSSRDSHNCTPGRHTRREVGENKLRQVSLFKDKEAKAPMCCKCSSNYLPSASSALPPKLQLNVSNYHRHQQGQAVVQAAALLFHFSL